MVLLWKHLRDLSAYIHMLLDFISMISCTVTQFASQKVSFVITAVPRLYCTWYGTPCFIQHENKSGFFQSHWILKKKKYKNKKPPNQQNQIKEQRLKIQFKKMYKVHAFIIHSFLGWFETGMCLNWSPSEDRHLTQQSSVVSKELREQNQGAEF